MIVLDSSFLVAFHNTRDVYHDSAVGVMRRFLDGEWGAGLLLEYVFLEVATVLAVRVSLGTAVGVCDRLLRADELEFVPCSDVFLDAYARFRDQGERGLSFADAAIVAVARERAAPAVATFDAGFRGIEGVTPVPGS